MDKPTDEQVKEFWERCGFEDINEDCTYGRHPSWGIGDMRSRMPGLDLNNLFKYAKEAFIKKFGYGRWTVLLSRWVNYMYKHRLVDPADSLFFLIYEAIKEK